MNNGTIPGIHTIILLKHFWDTRTTVKGFFFPDYHHISEKVENFSPKVEILSILQLRIVAIFFKIWSVPGPLVAVPARSYFFLCFWDFRLDFGQIIRLTVDSVSCLALLSLLPFYHEFRMNVKKKRSRSNYDRTTVPVNVTAIIPLEVRRTHGLPTTIMAEIRREKKINYIPNFYHFCHCW